MLNGLLRLKIDYLVPCRAILGHLGVLLALLEITSSYYGHAVTLSTLSALPVPMLRQVTGRAGKRREFYRLA